MNDTLNNRYCRARRACIAREFDALNPQQRQGVLATEGPLLLLAGAGSGKTTVLIHRIANLLQFGRGSDCDEVPEWVTEEELLFLETCGPDEDPDRLRRLCAVEPPAPWQVLAITFTNRAANELKARLEDRLGPRGRDVWASTFHSACLRILRRDADRLGFDTRFTVYDADDSLRVIKRVLAELNLDDRMYPPKTVLGRISQAKDNLRSPGELADEAADSYDVRLPGIAKAYAAYQQALREANAMDFDDLIYWTVRLLQQHEDVRLHWQNRFHYVLIDEYQDTNHAQYLLASLLAGGRGNLCVVGDDDQSIYKFRGATIRNILDFEKHYPNARVIRLEQNYRSTQNILDAANAVIRNNQGRKGKELWTEHSAGSPITVYMAADEREEAQYVALRVLDACRRGRPWRDSAVLYRMNAQSQQLEYAFKRDGIPYRVYGGTPFFSRAEIKDMIAYLWVLLNPADELRLRRVVNNPPRGIGERSLAVAAALADEAGCSLYTVISRADRYPELQRSAPRFLAFTAMIDDLRAQMNTLSLPELYELLLERSGYLQALEGKRENESRAENVKELKTSLEQYAEAEDDPSLAGFLDMVALYTDLDDESVGDDCVHLMSMHSAKGLEYPCVYLVGMEEGIFPGYRSLSEPEDLEEERRLCYVAMTRAKEELTLLHTEHRMLFGRTSANPPSRFLEEIPEQLVRRMGSRPKAPDQPRQEYRSAASLPSRNKKPVPTAAPRTAPKVSLQAGDQVEHRAFGRGTVTKVQPVGGDALLEIAFDRVGTKRLLFKTAMAQMKKL